MTAVARTIRSSWMAGIAHALSRHLTLIGTSAFILMPFLWMLSLSSKPPHEAFQAEVSLLPDDWHIVENYGEALTSVPMLRFMLNGAIICLTVLVLQIAVAAPAAYALAKHRFFGRDAIFALVLVGLLIPHQALAIPLFAAFHQLGILDSFAALILPGVISPFAIFLFRQFFKTVPDDLVHAGRLDGLSELSIVWRIMLPLAMPAVIAFSILSVVGRWNDLFLPLIMIRLEELMTPPLGIYYFRSQEAGTAFGPLMAAAVLVVLPLIVGFLVAQRRFVEGLSLGGVK